MQTKLATMLLAAACLGIAGCAPSDKGSETTSPTNSTTSTNDTKGKSLNIAVIPKGSTHEYWKSIHAGAQAAADELGVKITFKGPEKEDDRESQVKTVEDFVTDKVDGIVLAPLDDNALRAPVKDAANDKIPVLVIDSALNGGNTVGFVATDNEKAGHLAGDQMVKLLNGKGKIVMLRYAEGSASTMAREKGFLDAIKAAPNIQVVSSDQHGGSTTESAQKAGENLLAPLKTGDGKLSIDGIYTPNESTTFGMLRVLQDAKLAGKVKFIGFDVSDKLIEGLTSGQIDGLVVQNPYKMGYLGVKTLVQIIRGEKPTATIDTGATLITKENMGTAENKDLLNPKKI